MLIAFDYILVLKLLLSIVCWVCWIGFRLGFDCDSGLGLGTGLGTGLKHGFSVWNFGVFVIFAV